MKKILLLTLGVSVLISSCKKEEENEKEKETEQEQEAVVVEAKNGVLNYNVGGVLWESETVEVLFEEDSKMISINGEMGDEEFDMILVSDDDNYLKSYNLSSEYSSTANYSDGSDYYTTYSAFGEGVATVTEFDTTNKTITGSFNFIGGQLSSTSTLEIKDGLFTKLSYTE